MLFRSARSDDAGPATGCGGSEAHRRRTGGVGEGCSKERVVNRSVERAVVAEVEVDAREGSVVLDYAMSGYELG